MAAAGNEAPLDLQQVLLLSHPHFDVPFRSRLTNRYRLLLSADDPQSLSVKVALCVANFPVNAALLRRLPALELVVGTSSGLDHVDLEECRRRGIAVTNASPAYAEDVADYAVGLFMDVLRRVSAADRFVRAGLWRVRGEYSLGSKVGGKRVGIVGLGSIGSMVARRLHAFGCHIAYTSRKKNSSAPFPYYANTYDLAASSDALILCCMLTDETRHIVNGDVLRAMGKGGVIVNVGRGGLIDEMALVQALVRGDIEGVGLDVFEDEPNVPSELYELENVVLSPHKAMFTPEAFAALEGLVMGNLEAFFSNKSLSSEFMFR